MIYELIFLEDKDESADNNPNEDCDEENESKISEMVGLASVASLSAAASVSSMLNTGPSSNNLGGGGNQHGNLGRALSRKDLKKDKKEVNLFGPSLSKGLSMGNLQHSAATSALVMRREVYVPAVDSGRTDRALPAESEDVSEPRSPSAPSVAGPSSTVAAASGTGALTPSPTIATAVVGRSKPPLSLASRLSPKQSPAASPRHSPRGAGSKQSPRGGSNKGVGGGDRSDTETVQSRSSSGKSNKGDLLSIVESSYESSNIDDTQSTSTTGKPQKGSKSSGGDKGEKDTAEAGGGGGNATGSRTSSGKSAKGELLSIVESERERDRDEKENSPAPSGGKKASKFPVMEKLELDVIDGYSPRSRTGSSRRQSKGELLVIFEGDNSTFDKDDDRERDRDRVERLPQKEDFSSLPSLADKKKLRAELLAIMEGQNDEAVDESEYLSPRSDSEDFDRDRDRMDNHSGLTPRIQYCGRTYTKGELLVIFEDDRSESEFSVEGGGHGQERERERDRDWDRRASEARPSEDISTERRASKVDLLTIVEGDGELDVAQSDIEETSQEADLRDGLPVPVSQRQHRPSKGDLLVIFEDKDESESEEIKIKDPGRDREKNRDRIALQEKMERKRLRAELLAIMEGVDDDAVDDENLTPRSDNQDVETMDGLSSGTPRNRNKHQPSRADLLAIVEEDGGKETDLVESEVAPSPRSARGLSHCNSVDLGLDRISEDEIADHDNSNIFHDLHVEPKTRTDVSAQSGHGLACILEDLLDDPEEDIEMRGGGRSQLTLAAIAAHESRTTPNMQKMATQGTPPKAQAQSRVVSSPTLSEQRAQSVAKRVDVQGPRMMHVQAQKDVGLVGPPQQQYPPVYHGRPSSAPVREAVQVGSALDDEECVVGGGMSSTGNLGLNRGVGVGPRPSSGKVQLISKKKALAMAANPFNSSAGAVSFLSEGSAEYEQGQPNPNSNSFNQQQIYQSPEPYSHQQFRSSPAMLQQHQQQQWNTRGSAVVINNNSPTGPRANPNHMEYSINVMSTISSSLANQNLAGNNGDTSMKK